MDAFCSRWSPAQTLMLQIGVLLTNALPGPQSGKDARAPCSLMRIVGESAHLRLNSSLPPDIREIEWTWDSEEGKSQLLASWKPTATSADWYKLEEKYRSRLKLTDMAVLSVENLTLGMSGLYTAKIKFHSGKSQDEAFRLCLYEPVPHPQIQIHSLSSTLGWCNVSLECGSPGTTKNLTVIWLSNGLPRDREQRGTQQPAPNSRNLSLSLPWSQLDAHLTCEVSSPAEAKNATLHLDSICPWEGSPQSKWLWTGILPTVLLVSLGAGLWIWIRKKRETGKGVSALLPAVPGPAAAALVPEEPANPQAGGADSDNSLYTELTFLRHPKDMEKGGYQSHRPACTPEAHIVYDNIQTTPEPQRLWMVTPPLDIHV